MFMSTMCLERLVHNNNAIKQRDERKVIRYGPNDVCNMASDNEKYSEKFGYENYLKTITIVLISVIMEYQN